MGIRILAAATVVTLLCAPPARAAQPGVDDVLERTRAMMGRGDYRGALALLEPLTAATALTPLQHARLYHLLGAAHTQLGAAERALQDADVAERDALAVQDFDLLARIESIRGTVYLQRGRSLDGLRSFLKCAAWAERSKQPAVIAGAYTRVAAAYQDMGDWTRALDAVNRAGEAAPQPDPQTRAQYLTRKGLIQIELHDGASAKSSIEAALALARQMRDRRTEAQVLIDLALLHQRLDRDLPRAIDAAAQAAAIGRALRMPDLRGAALNELGSLLRESGRYAEARQRLTEALAVIAASNEHRDEPYVLKNLGQTLLALGLTTDGAQRLREAAAAADRAHLTRVRWLARLALAELDAGRDAAAADAGFAAVLDIVEAQQTNVLLEGFRAGALDETLAEHDPYDRYVQFLLSRGEAARAFTIAERQRARAFLDTLSTARDALSAAVPPGYADAERELLRRISARRAELQTTGEPFRRSALAASVDDDERALTALRLRLAAERPALAHARYPVPSSLADVQGRLLAPDEVLLAFFLGADRSTAWLVGRTTFTTFALPPRHEIEDRVQAALAALREPHAHRPAAAIDALSRTLNIAALAGIPDRTRLIIVPHGILYALPFEVLAGADGRPLLERFPISYAASASSLAFLRSERAVAHPAATLVAVGNPAGGVSPLPYSAAELHAVASLFGRHTRVLEGADATEGRVRDEMRGGARMLHFATHGAIDEAIPDRSGLLLTARPPAEDGLLQMREIYGMRMDADLVTLSACQTALGRNVSGEGVIGLARAFYYAGARAVVASLWDVDDRSTALLMQRFYAQLRAGQPIDVALQRAKLSMLREPAATAAPFYWAAFIASGRANVALDLPPEGWRDRVPAPFVWLGAIVATLAVLLGAAAWRTRARRRGGAAATERVS